MENIISEKIKYLVENGDYLKLKNYVQHNNYSTYDHCILVAEMSLKIAKKLHIKIDYGELAVAALLHDYYLYDYHDYKKTHRHHGFTHGKQAMNNAIRDYHINKQQQQAIARHMFPKTLPPTNRLGIIITIADKTSALLEMLFKKTTADGFAV